MKLLRVAVVVLAVAVMVANLAGTLFAVEKMHHKDWQKMCQDKIKALKDSAVILQKTNPDLAKGLTDLASEKEKMMQEMTDMKAQHETKTKMLRDSAAILQKTNPDLAKELWDMSEHKHMNKGWMGKKGCSMCTKGHEEEERAEQ
jgi:accessory colonization factor AcfC